MYIKGCNKSPVHQASYLLIFLYFSDMPLHLVTFIWPSPLQKSEQTRQLRGNCRYDPPTFGCGNITRHGETPFTDWCLSFSSYKRVLPLRGPRNERISCLTSFEAQRVGSFGKKRSTESKVSFTGSRHFKPLTGSGQRAFIQMLSNLVLSLKAWNTYFLNAPFSSLQSTRSTIGSFLLKFSFCIPNSVPF